MLTFTSISFLINFPLFLLKDIVSAKALTLALKIIGQYDLLKTSYCYDVTNKSNNVRFKGPDKPEIADI